MPSVVYRAINLLALLLATAWWGSSKDFEAAITALGLFAALGYQEYRVSSYGDTHDKNLYERFLTEFPSNGRSMRFLNDHDMGTSYLAEQLEEFDLFVQNWRDAEHEFHNELLNSYLRVLQEKANAFAAFKAFNVFANAGGVRTMDLADFETDPKKLKIKEMLNSMATEVYNAHQSLVRQGRKLL